MRLRGKILIVLTITFALLVAGLYALASLTVMKGFLELESESMTTDVRRAHDALASDVKNLAEKNGDWAYWDDLYNYIENPDPRFVVSTVSDAALDSMRVDYLVVVDTEGKPLISRGFDRQTQTSVSPPDELLEMLKPGGALYPHPGKAVLTPTDSNVSSERLIILDPPDCEDASMAGIVQVNGWCIVATRPVLHSDKTGPVRGRIAFVRRLDPAAQEIAARTHLKVSMGTEFATAPAPTGAGNEKSVGIAITSPTTIVGETVVHDLMNQPIFVLRVEAFRHIVQRGEQSVAFLAVCIVTSGLAFGIATYLATDRLVLSRLLRLSNEVNSIGKTGASSGRVFKDGNDELAELANAINHALAAIETTQRLVVERDAETRKLALVAARTDNTVVLTDPRGRIEWVNEGFTRQTGYSLSEVLGKKPGEFLQGPDTDPATISHMREQLKLGRGFHVQLVNYHKNGSSYWVDVEVQPIFDQEGKLVNFMAIESDVTESRRLTQELRDARDSAESANRAKSQFLANMSHEIRTPMTAILGFAELLNDSQTTLSQRDNYSHAIVRNGHHLLAIINDILDLSKIEAEKMTVEHLQTSVTQILAEVVGIMKQLATEKQLALKINYLSPIPSQIMSDPFRLRQILTNLVSNAVKFTEKGSVTINVSMLDHFEADSPRISFEVIDTGPGMTTTEQGRLFEPFTQADPSTTRRFGGTGLGLAISLRLAQLLGGDLTMKSEVGKGSAFTLVVPTGPLKGIKPIADPVAEQAQHEEPAKASSTVLPGRKPLENTSILLAEDGIDNQRLISFMLTQAGANVSVVSDGSAALEWLENAKSTGRSVDLILMDMQMPELDGYDATRILRERGVRTPVIALTAHAMASDREKCLAAGCDDYVTKPINRDRMLKLLAGHLEKQREKQAPPNSN